MRSSKANRPRPARHRELPVGARQCEAPGAYLLASSRAQRNASCRRGRQAPLSKPAGCWACTKGLPGQGGKKSGTAEAVICKAFVSYKVKHFVGRRLFYLPRVGSGKDRK